MSLPFTINVRIFGKTNQQITSNSVKSHRHSGQKVGGFLYQGFPPGIGEKYQEVRRILFSFEAALQCFNHFYKYIITHLLKKY